MTGTQPQSDASEESITEAPLASGEEATREKATTHEAGKDGEEQQTEAQEEIQPPYTILTEKGKIFTIMMASFAAFISPVSGSIYYPALNSLSRDLHVSISTMNLTITVYLVASTF